MNAINVAWSSIEAKGASIFGVTSFRPGQRELLESVLEGHDALGILPTGGGKSLCFQLASIFLPHLVVVVTPLISLSEDQTDKLELRHVAATRVDSTLTAAEQRQALRGVRSGRLELVYVTPERLARSEFIELLQRSGVSLIVVDEAHCISQWGHDFRPAFLHIRHAAAALGRPPILALTATATRATERDIVEQLGLSAPRIVRTSGERRNLFLRVQPTDTDEDKDAALLDLLAAEHGSGLVYTSTIRAAEALAGRLVDANIAVGLYHGHLPPAVRDAVQDAFMDGRYRVIVATKAFGMGIDKAETRFVVHYQLPDSIESYYQEVGRAGRDGLPARTVLYYRRADRRVQQFFLLGKYPRPEQIDAFVKHVHSQTSERINLDDAHLPVPERPLQVLLADLESLGAVRWTPQGWSLMTRDTLDAQTSVLAERYAQRRHDDQARLADLIAYIEQATCRTATILRYFGEDPSVPCGHCDNCGPPT